ncbi:MAG TPA: HD domain-containing phosphohydrolase [Candidatus Acidoferrales bacterium]|nr:HD domain-containing phosphohydrolase [Candidatus Acidoferrales bacterium]
MNREHILVVDDEEAIREVVTTLLEAQGYSCTAASNGKVALQYLNGKSPDLVLSDMVMPEMDGMKLLEWIHAHDKDIPVIMVTAMHDLSTALEAMRRGAYDYILKPFEKDQLFLGVRRALEHRKLLVENRRYQQELEKLVEDRTAQLRGALEQLERSYDDTLEALGGALDLRDAETEGHCKRVTAFSLAICKVMRVETEKLHEIARGAFLHDIGKMAIPDHILRKPGPLSAEEQEVMRTHCVIGHEMLSRVPFLRGVAGIVLAHQERFDGTGYPRGLKGEEIPLGARIFAVADTLDAMTSDRPYRAALSLEEAKAEIRRCTGTQFDPRVVEAFLSIPDDTWRELRVNSSGALRMAHSKDF